MTGHWPGKIDTYLYCYSPPHTESNHGYPCTRHRLCCAVISRSVMSKSLWPHGLWPTRLLCPGGFSRLEYWSGLTSPSPGDLPNPDIKTRSPILQADSLASEPPGKPKSTRIGSLSPFWEIFPSQEMNQGLLLWCQILYQLSYQGSPWHKIGRAKLSRGISFSAMESKDVVFEVRTISEGGMWFKAPFLLDITGLY